MSNTTTAINTRLLFALSSEKEMDTYLETMPTKGIISDIKSLIDTSTLRQKALLEFMCAMMKGTTWNATEIARVADEFVTAYINQLNKEI